MARGVNKVILLGNLGNDPDVRYTAGGAAVANVSLATTFAWRDKESGDMRENTEWHRIVFFGKLAEIVSEYLRKGSQVYIEGRLQTRKWQDKEGQDRWSTEIVASDMQMLGGRGGGSGEAGGPPPRGEAPAANPQAGGGGAGDGGAGGDSDFVDDDIPF